MQEGVHKDNLINDMLKNIPDPKMRSIYGQIASGDIAQKVLCMSEDIYEDREVALLDENDEPVLFKSGPHKGEPKTKVENVLVRKGCAGRVIAHIYSDGRIEETPPVESDSARFGYESGLEGSRIRFDGQRGFRCYCGNNSIMCEEEKGILNPNMPVPPTQDDLYQIAERLSKRETPNLTPDESGKLSIDGFVIEEVRI